MKKTKIVAFCGLMAALSTVMLMLGGILPLATFACPILAMMPVAVSQEEAGRKGAVGVFLVSAVLGLLLCADREAAVFYILCGGYPILQKAVKPMKKPIAIGIKAVAVNVALVISYVVSAKLIGIEDTELTGWLLGLLWLMGNLLFFLLDITLEKLFVLYRRKWRKSFF